MQGARVLALPRSQERRELVGYAVVFCLFKSFVCHALGVELPGLPLLQRPVHGNLHTLRAVHDFGALAVEESLLESS